MGPRTDIKWIGQAALRPAAAEELLQALAAAGVHLPSEAELTPAQREWIRELAKRQQVANRVRDGVTAEEAWTVGSTDPVQEEPKPAPLWTRPPVVDWREECRGRYGDKR